MVESATQGTLAASLISKPGETIALTEAMRAIDGGGAYICREENIYISFSSRCFMQLSCNFSYTGHSRADIRGLIGLATAYYSLALS